MNIPLPAAVLHAITQLNNAGYEAYAVGGCVRDCLMGKSPNDWDITTSALPEQTAEVFFGYRILDTGIQHGTITVFVEDAPLEITTYRIDGDYSDGRHPDCVLFTRSLHEDLQRRDFTINAMAYHPANGLIDPFDGRQDLDSGIIRCVGNSHARFTEDALRIIRALRFSATLGFDIDTETTNAIHHLAHSLSKVAIERISSELTKLICGQNVATVFDRFSDVFQLIFPCEVPFAGTSAILPQVPADPLSRYAALLFLNSPQEVELVATHLRFSHHLTNDLLCITRQRHAPLSTDTVCILHLLHALGPQKSVLLAHLRSLFDHSDSPSLCATIQQLANSNACYRLSDLAINGDDLIDLGFTPGPKIGTILNHLLNRIMDGKLTNNRAALIAYAKQL